MIWELSVPTTIASRQLVLIPPGFDAKGIYYPFHEISLFIGRILNYYKH